MEITNPVLNDMSITLIPGRHKTVAHVLDDALEAERLGFKRIWIPERYNVKEAGVLCGAIGARTQRIGVGPGPLSVGSRAPILLASMGATMQSLYGDRFTLGLGRSEALWLQGHGFTETGYQSIIDRAEIIKKLWNGEVVNYEGPAGSYKNLSMIDKPDDFVPPKIVFFHIGGPKASKAAAHPVWDEIALCNLMSDEAVGNSIQQTKEEAQRMGRDPESLYFIAPVTTAPDMNETDTLAYVAARIVIGIQLPTLGGRLIIGNRWEEDIVNKIRNHPQFAGMNKALIDHSFHRDGLLEPAKLVPERWLRHSAAIGSSEEVVAKLEKYIEAGAHEIDLYGTNPKENAKVLEIWRNKRHPDKA